MTETPYAWLAARQLAEDRKRREREARIEATFGRDFDLARNLNDALTLIEEDQ